jgi:NitT/TauT family transport system ATP-binding protein
MGELRIDHLWKSFPIAASWRTPRTWHPVLQDVTFSVAEGEFVSVVGRSGCGKSTLLNIAAGLEPASGGAVYVNDAEIRGPGLDRSVVFQDFALFPWLSVRDNIAFGLRSMGLPHNERRARADRYVELVGLTQFADYYPRRLSGGMRQRVGIGRALAIEPAVLLMDEPFGSLDAMTRQNMQDALADIWRMTHKTILFVTHDIGEAVFLSDRILVLDGAPSQIALEVSVNLPRPRSARSAQFQDYVSRLNTAVAGDRTREADQRG